MDTLAEQVAQSLQHRCLLKPGQKILVAVSGGLDSMVLLHLLHALSFNHGWKLTVAHFNHRLRGRSSDADERLVQQTAAKLGLPFVRGQAEVGRYARQHGLSLEMAARRLRHLFLARAARRRGIAVVALAHHADDQVELFFVRLFRGAGGAGLAGMQWRSPSPVCPHVWLIRPLLDQPRAALRHYAQRHGIHFREDHSNVALDVQRNRIRHQLLPWLKKTFQPALDAAVLRLMDLVGAEAAFVSTAAAQWLAARKRRPTFGRLPVAVQRRCVQLQLLQHKIAPDFALVERLRLYAGQPVCVGPKTSVWRDSDGLLRLQQAGQGRGPRKRGKGERLTVELEGPRGKVAFGGAEIQWAMRRQRGTRRPPRGEGVEYFDAAKVGSPITLRHWQPGDRFQPIGMSWPVKLQDLFTNAKIPRAQRHRLIVAVTPKGEIFWVEGLRMGDHFKLDNTTRRRLKWRWQRLPNRGCGLAGHVLA